MKVTIKTKELKNALELHKKIVQKVKVPILNGIRLKAIENTLELHSTDLEFSLKSTLNATVDISDGLNEVLVPLKNLENAIKSTNKEQISLELVDDHLKIDGKLNLNTLNLEDFPRWIEVNGDSVVVDRAKFFEVLTKVYDCVSTDPIRPILNGYCINTTDNEIVATDSYRLAVAKFPFNKEIIVKDKDWNEACTERVEKATGNLIVPIKTYDILKKLNGEELKLTMQENQIAFTIGNIQLVSRLLSGRYPEYKNIIESVNCKSEFEFEPKELIEQLIKIEKSLLTGDQKGVPIKLTFETNNIKVTCEVKDIGSYEDQVVATGTTENPIEMAFNPFFMVSILKQFEGKVKIGIDSAMKPVIIEQSDGESDSIEVKYLLMPIRVS